MSEELTSVWIQLGKGDQRTLINAWPQTHHQEEKPLALLLELREYGSDHTPPYYFPLVFENRAEAAETFLRISEKLKASG